VWAYVLCVRALEEERAFVEHKGTGYLPKEGCGPGDGSARDIEYIENIYCLLEFVRCVMNYIEKGILNINDRSSGRDIYHMNGARETSRIRDEWYPLWDSGPGDVTAVTAEAFRRQFERALIPYA